MDQPKGFVDTNYPNYICRLQKAIYGLKHAPRAWFNRLKCHLLQCDFRACYSDTSLFVRTTPTDVIYVLVYVDDIIVTGSKPSMVSTFIQQLHSVFKLKDLGKLSYFLGVEVTYSTDTIHLSQYKYIRDLLDRCGMLEAKPISSPAGLISCRDPPCDFLPDPSIYKQVVGSL
ncbi:unnamed protein product [Rhodiola kirilowii]